MSKKDKKQAKKLKKQAKKKDKKLKQQGDEWLDDEPQDERVLIYFSPKSEHYHSYYGIIGSHDKSVVYTWYFDVGVFTYRLTSTENPGRWPELDLWVDGFDKYRVHEDEDYGIPLYNIRGKETTLHYSLDFASGYDSVGDSYVNHMFNDPSNQQYKLLHRGLRLLWNELYDAGMVPYGFPFDDQYEEDSNES